MDGHAIIAEWRGLAGESEQGERLDKVLSAHIKTTSRARLQAIIRSGGVRVGGAVVTDPSRPVKAGEALEVAFPDAEPAAVSGEAIPLTIVHEDRHVIVIDKPAGLSVHPGPGHASGTLVNALIAHCGESLSGIGGVMRPGIVHRLDKDTTGLMVIAKHDAAHRTLAAQFADHGRTGALRREYLALVWGAPHPAVGRIETRMGRHPASRVKMAVLKSGGRIAITHYAIERMFGDPKPPQLRYSSRGVSAPLASLVRCRLETGRTHQVRVHMAHKGTPLIADPLYASGYSSRIRALPKMAQDAIMALDRQALHAAVLAFNHPETGKLLRFESPLPDDMKQVCQALETFR